MILDRAIGRMGDWNPQVFREFKERLTIRNMSITVGLSLLMQALIGIYYNTQLPIYNPDRAVSNIRYCLVGVDNENLSMSATYSNYPDSCSFDTPGHFKIDWHLWWSDIFTNLSWILPFILIAGSVYLLAADLIREEKRGTLNFIRLSPQSAQTIFIGKILGVPSLIYLATAAFIPLHLFAGLHGDSRLSLLTAWYVTIGAMSLLLSSAAVAYVLLGGNQAIVPLLAIVFLVREFLLPINAFLSSKIDARDWFRGIHGSSWLWTPIRDLSSSNRLHLSWFGMPIFDRPLWFYAFLTVLCAIGSYWIWQVLERRYINPTATAIGKYQSYAINLGFQIWLAGFAVSVLGSSDSYHRESLLVALSALDLLGLLFLIPLLLPNKQALQEWSRYRRDRGSDRQLKFWQRGLVRDLIANDRSPALLAIAINIGMALCLWLPIALIFFPHSEGRRFAAGLCVATSLSLIYAVIAHLGLFLNFKHRSWSILAIVVGAMLLPIGFAFVIGPTNGTPRGITAIFFLFSPFAPAGIFGLSGGTILATFMAQLAIFAGLTHQLQRKLKIVGQSQTQDLLVGAASQSENRSIKAA